METLLYIIHVGVCLAMLPIILLQAGKGGGVSATFGGGGSGTVFGSRGASSFLQRVTSGAAIIFMCTSMGLSWYSSQTRSVVGDIADNPTPNTGTETLSGDDNAQVPAPAAGTATPAAGQPQDAPSQ